MKDSVWLDKRNYLWTNQEVLFLYQLTSFTWNIADESMLFLHAQMFTQEPKKCILLTNIFRSSIHMMIFVEKCVLMRYMRIYRWFNIRGVRVADCWLAHSLFRNKIRQAELENERYFEFSIFCTGFVTWCLKLADDHSLDLGLIFT